MLYKTLFNCDAKTLRELRNVKTNDALRDNFTEKELALIEEGETIITALIALGFTYKQIEEHLKNKYIKQITQK
jgi:Holliday junction resolvasome RuvABC DNA-binding subunit